MMLLENHKTVEILLPSPAGTLEALLEIPDHAECDKAAVICHPHPLYGGSMHGKVVVTAAHAFLDLGIPSLRFNFRGVGKSSGKYDGGIGEQDDVKAAVDYFPGKVEGIIIAGHSFGAWVGMKAGCIDRRVKMLIGIGMPVVDFFPGCPKPKILIHGTRDELIPLENVEEFHRMLPEPKKLIKIEGADHFFTGKLKILKEAVRDATEAYFPA